MGTPGCEKITAHELFNHSWNLIGPAVVSASKSGAMLPRRREVMLAR
jgi:hypothetical protein